MANQGEERSKKCEKAQKNVTKSKEKPVEPPLIEFPHILRIIGPKHVKIALQFVPSAIIYSITSFVLLTYMSEWKTVLQYLPFYGGKYYVEENDKKADKKEENEDEECKQDEHVF